ncbi:putative hydroxymethylpyrimidine transport system substrate-binding protein [Salsuginibacillus halophilus]|uniref:Putative hydroxymethylpyrimidine transport system substrate-binding protein n=1 Tax=Salsuginibacillus halophilus TaxID=517424 RepID=A0A2P8HWW4_9BACI|nr:ABC transporter substrate-binding protein [Salsuginibacillus halophilus]PSL50733.1 putative hydroxymethylpyrimidine transport system substrate-binding protein [Salsuginibacillus halophilus]
MWKRVTIVLSSFMLLNACGSEDASSDTTDEITLMLDWYPNAVHSYLYAAEEKGYFEEENIDVDIQFPANPTDPTNLTGAGEVDLAMSYEPTVLMSRDEGLPVVTVAPIVQSPLNHIMTLSESGIETPADLEGKTVGYPGGATNEPIVEQVLAHADLTMEDITLTDVGFDIGPALVSGSVDAIVGAYINHEYPLLQQEGHDISYMNPVEKGVPSYDELVLIANENELAENEEVYERFWSAASKGYEVVKDDPDNGLELLLKHEEKEEFPLNEDVEQASMDILLEQMETEERAFGEVSEEESEQVAAWLYETGLVDEKPDIEDALQPLNDHES